MKRVTGQPTVLAALGLLLGLALYLAVQPLAPDPPVVEAMTAGKPGTDMPVFYVRTKAPVIALTFDNSWGTKALPPVLEVLRRQHVRATFFLSSPWAERHPDLVQAVAAEGHEIASHGEAHVNLSRYERSEIARNIGTAHRVLRELTASEPRFFRPPNGDYDDRVVAVARELGYETVIWSVDSLDWKRPGPLAIVERVTRLAFPGAIVLFHASDSAPDTPAALPSVIQLLEQRGYRLMAMGDALNHGEPGRDDPRGRPDYPPND
ncbi:MAG: polysaccharide deacetylase family protein [Clostridia bacterium]|nr:polysaccharide deacetylase family protein [Clostridia bacterium]